jgi:imidazolonepropionase-like amidohydrolase
VSVTFTRDELSAIVDEARRKGRGVAAHVNSDAGARQAIECGVASIEHLGELTRATLDEIAARGIFVVPTLSVMKHYADNPPSERLRERRKKRWDTTVASFALARAAGVRLVCGSDIGAYPHALGALSELRLYMELGMSASEALTSATSAAAAMLGVEDGGRVAPGMAADLCVWSGELAAAPPTVVVRAGRVIMPT